MRFVSYAQNFEDVMLWRALRHVRGGFYIDVGANDPEKDSVTKAFYERGWRGINVEPVAAHHADLERERPLDINLRIAVGEANGTIALWECETPGLATTDATVVEQHLREGRGGAWHQVPVVTLAQLCEEHVPQGDIQFLKVDVEGGEQAVLAGADFRRFRPWIVVVEATRPNSREQKHDQWEHLLTGAGYRFGYADGLNRFYVAEEHPELMAALSHPPNIFDAFIVAQQFNVEQQAQQLKDTVGRLDAQVRALDAQANQAAQNVAQAAQRVAQAEQTAAQAAQRLAQAEQTAAQAAQQVAQAAQREAQSEQRAAQAEQRVAQGNAQARQLQEIADRLEGQLVKAAESAALANERALQFSDRATQAETRTQDWVARAVRAETELRVAEEMIRSTQRLLSQRDSQLEQADLTVQQVYTSTSWRITRPLRWVSGRLKGEPRSLRALAGGAGGVGAAAGADPGLRTPGEAAAHPAGQHLPPRAQAAYDDMKSGAAGAREDR